MVYLGTQHVAGPAKTWNQRVLTSWTRAVALQPRLFSLTLNRSFVFNAVSLTLH
jgi:hypothetical protein